MVVEVVVAVLLATARERGEHDRVLRNAALQLPVEVRRHRLPVLGDGVLQVKHLLRGDLVRQGKEKPRRSINHQS